MPNQRCEYKHHLRKEGNVRKRLNANPYIIVWTSPMDGPVQQMVAVEVGKIRVLMFSVCGYRYFRTVYRYGVKSLEKHIPINIKKTDFSLHSDHRNGGSKMKGNLVLMLLAGILLFKGEPLLAQVVDEVPIFTEAIDKDMDSGPIIFKFEPYYLLSVDDRKQQIKHYRALIYTMDISDRKKRALLKDLYRNVMSDRLSKVLLANNKFEDVE